MPNIKQQERRVRTAARQRLDNLRRRSSAKTLFKRVAAAVEEGDEARIVEEQRQLARALDKAAAKRAIHPNKAARKKAQAARVVASRSGQ